jgi:hypothetical protein
MLMRILPIGIVLLLSLNAPAIAEMYKIDNPASNIYNPATRIDNPNPISPPTQPVPQPVVTEATTTRKPATQIKEQPQSQPKHNISNKSYHFKTAAEYIDAAKKSFNSKDYKKVLSITEEALSRIRSGTLKASRKTKQKLNEYRASGYRLLEKMKAKEVQ